MGLQALLVLVALQVLEAQVQQALLVLVALLDPQGLTLQDPQDPLGPQDHLDLLVLQDQVEDQQVQQVPLGLQVRADQLALAVADRVDLLVPQDLLVLEAQGHQDPLDPQVQQE